ncbi:MAG: hypothetical protein GY765_35770 [bacterium]|nr:hypothetical protein [bacterium]
MGLLKYDISFDPSQPTVTLKVSVDNTDVNIKVKSVESFSISVKPSGNVIQEVFSAVAMPIAEIIKGKLSPKIPGWIEGKSFKASTLPNIPITAEGVTVTMKPSKIKLSTYNGMLMADGNVDIT